jgi:hypothetical protein
MIKQLYWTHFAKFFLNPLLYRALFPFCSALKVSANFFELFTICTVILPMVFEGEYKKYIFIEGDFLGHNRSSLKDGSFDFLIVLKFFYGIGIKGIQELRKHGLFLLFFDWSFFWVLRLISLLIFGVFVENLVVR